MMVLKTIEVVTDEQGFNYWLDTMKSNKPYVTPQWIIDTIKTPCSFVDGVWENGIARITFLVRESDI